MSWELAVQIAEVAQVPMLIGLIGLQLFTLWQIRQMKRLTSLSTALDGALLFELQSLNSKAIALDVHGDRDNSERRPQ